MMMWKKESNDTNASYVDIFSDASDLEFCAQNYQAIQTQLGVTIEAKRERLSLAYRNNGNTLFGEGKWVAAMEKYNDSLRFAKTGSPNISLALANRSACFLHLKMYDECLIDIESAIKFQYPDNLMWKLEQRKRDCMKNTEERTTIAKPVNDIGRKLSFEADKNIPCMANVLQMNIDGGNFSIVAKDDIGVGQTIVIERSFTSYLFMHYGHKCNICLKERTNLRPCKTCTAAMFCSDECERHPLHELECNLKFCDKTQTNGQILEGVRLIFSVINQFANVNELIGFVEEQVNHFDRKELPISLADFQSNYRAFLKLPVSSEFVTSDNFLVMLYATYTFSLTVPKVNEWFPSSMHRRFLAHLIGHHMRILEKNSIKNRYLDKQTSALSYVGVMNQYFEHSCTPNVFNGECNGSNVLVTIRPVKKGDLLQISYVELRASMAERQMELQQRFQINCKCVRCNNSSPTTTAQNEIGSDPDFKEIVGFNISDLYVSAADQSLEMIEKCVASLDKYKNIAWCNEIEQLVDMFIRIIRIHFANPLPYSIEEILMNRFGQLAHE